MNDWLLETYLPALACTLAIELGVAVMLGFWTRRELLAVILVNLVTHPALHLILWLLFRTRLLPLDWPVLTALEVAVFLAEWAMLARWLRLSARRAATVSFCMNAASALLGCLLTI